MPDVWRAGQLTVGRLGLRRGKSVRRGEGRQSPLEKRFGGLGRLGRLIDQEPFD
jgi:hypothetical protein